MKTHKFRLAAALLAGVLTILCGISAAAEEPYTNYIYTDGGEKKYEPQAYVPDRVFTGESLGVGRLLDPQDLCVGPDGRCYVADTGNNRVLIFTKDWTLQRKIETFAGSSGEDRFNKPTGLFVTPDNRLYVADTDNRRVVVFDSEGRWRRDYGKPKTESLGENDEFRPTKLAVDALDQLYIVSSGTNKGMIQLDKEGNFLSFFGAIRVAPSLGQLLRRVLNVNMLTKSMMLNIPTEHSNVTIDSKGFVMATVSKLDPMKATAEMFISRLNPAGTDVLQRTGKYGPMGDIDIQYEITTGAAFRSQLCDIAVRPDGIYAVLDQRMGRVFTYTHEGILMFVFGGIGTRTGTFGQPTALDVTGEDRYLVLDGKYGQIVEFKPSEYGRLIVGAVGDYRERRYDASAEKWLQAMQYTSQSELVYNGVANAKYQAGDNEQAMKYYKLAHNQEGYSMAYKLYRSETLDAYFIWIAAGVLALAAALTALWMWRRHKKKRGGMPLE